MLFEGYVQLLLIVNFHMIKNTTSRDNLLVVSFDSAARFAVVCIQTMGICCMDLSFANVQVDLQLEVQILRGFMLL